MLRLRVDPWWSPIQVPSTADCVEPRRSEDHRVSGMATGERPYNLGTTTPTPLPGLKLREPSHQLTAGAEVLGLVEWGWEKEMSSEAQTYSSWAGMDNGCGGREKPPDRETQGPPSLVRRAMLTGPASCLLCWPAESQYWHREAMQTRQGQTARRSGRTAHGRLHNRVYKYADIGSTVHWLYAVTVEGHEWADVLQDVSTPCGPIAERPGNFADLFEDKLNCNPIYMRVSASVGPRFVSHSLKHVQPITNLLRKRGPDHVLPGLELNLSNSRRTTKRSWNTQRIMESSLLQNESAKFPGSLTIAGMKGQGKREIPENGVVRHDSHMRKSRETRPGLLIDLVGGEQDFLYVHGHLSSPASQHGYLDSLSSDSESDGRSRCPWNFLGVFPVFTTNTSLRCPAVRSNGRDIGHVRVTLYNAQLPTPQDNSDSRFPVPFLMRMRCVSGQHTTHVLRPFFFAQTRRMTGRGGLRECSEGARDNRQRGVCARVQLHRSRTSTTPAIRETVAQPGCILVHSGYRPFTIKKKLNPHLYVGPATAQHNGGRWRPARNNGVKRIEYFLFSYVEFYAGQSRDISNHENQCKAISFDQHMNKVMRPMAMLILDKVKEYTTSIQVDLKQGFQKCSFYHEQPIAQFKNANELLDFVIRKGVYPYDYMDSAEKLSETSLPSKDAFYNKLNKCDITDQDYEFPRKVWEKFNMKYLREYTELYKKNLITSMVFHGSRVSVDAMLKQTKIDLELLTDYDMILMREKGVRCGISQCCQILNI
ncbi:hypothetical protein PR048_014628 [Dryococelus australis]|uniref:Uncharacterized protein n=1 Tax=Dryococelus australis TaxID=614101 RepID=A0ABQ9HEX8_9NEOP|nr:hypothetical protein PR048_014628 [Dryococelus australis]